MLSCPIVSDWPIAPALPLLFFFVAIQTICASCGISIFGELDLDAAVRGIGG